MSRPIHGSDVYRALAHPVRRRIVELLKAHDGLTPGDMLDALRISRTSLSHHLRTLRDARLVAQRRRGRARLYVARPSAIRRMIKWADGIVA